MAKIDLLRNDYPRPQMVRDNWQNLNGVWDFQFDFGATGEERKMYLTENFYTGDVKKINVPFCPESKLSGIEYKDFMSAVLYSRKVTLPKEAAGKRVILHFGAVDYEAKVWVNDQLAGSHKGGYSSFSFDITALVQEGENTLTLWVKDEPRSGRQPHGKQSRPYYSKMCDYSRTTGIWQTVWMEFVPMEYVKGYKVYPNVHDSSVKIDVTAVAANGTDITLEASLDGKVVGKAQSKISCGLATVVMKLDELRLWDVGQPNLYDLTITMGEDKLACYFGMRTVEIKPDALYLNGRPFFMRLILDQGFNPDGIYTYPSDEYLKRDIELSMSLGFNGARLHERVFEERTLYYADKLGYVVWGEYANNNDQFNGNGVPDFLPEWMETMERDFNHPAIIGWCINNESYWMPSLDACNQETIYDVTKRLDPTRPVIDASGGVHFKTDMFDVHDYTADPVKFAEKLAPMLEDPKKFHNPIHQEQLARNVYEGQPYWISEYGGIKWGGTGWGYGGQVADFDAFVKRYVGCTKVLLDHARICGFCYTQLTDVEQETNGLYTYEREKKFPEEVYDAIREINTAPAYIEKDNK